MTQIILLYGIYADTISILSEFHVTLFIAGLLLITIQFYKHKNNFFFIKLLILLIICLVFTFWLTQFIRILIIFNNLLIFLVMTSMIVKFLRRSSEYLLTIRLFNVKIFYPIFMFYICIVLTILTIIND